MTIKPNQEQVGVQPESGPNPPPVDQVQPEPISPDRPQARKFRFNQVLLGLGKLSFSRLFLISLAVFLPVFILYNLSSVYKALLVLISMLKPFIIGASLAFLVKIPMSVVENLLLGHLPIKRKGLKRALSMFLTTGLILVIIIICLSLVLPQIIQSLISLEGKSYTFAHGLANYMDRFQFTSNYSQDLRNFIDSFSWDHLLHDLTEYLKTGSTSILQHALSTTSAIATGTTNGVFALFFMFYVLAAKERLSFQGKSIIYSYLSENHADRVLYITHLIHDNFAAFIGGQFLDAVMIAAWSYIGVIILGMPGLIMVPVIMGVTDLVPLVGPFVGTFLATLVVLIDSPVKALALLAYLLVVQQIQGNIIYPKLVGDRIGLPAMWTLVAVSLGGSLLGIVGMWIFCPLFAVVYLLLQQDTRVQLQAKQIDLGQKTGSALAQKRQARLGIEPEQK